MAVHSSTELTKEMFKIESQGEPVASIAELIPSFDCHDRVGIVVREPLGALHVSGFLMAMVTAFYDGQRMTKADFHIYPDYFVFHVGCAPGDYTMLDVWPTEHKSIRLHDAGEEVLRAINDRAITVLVIVDTCCRDRPLAPHTRNSALSRVKRAFLWTRSPEGKIRVQGNSQVEAYVEDAIERTGGLGAKERQAALQQRREVCIDNHMAEFYQAISVEESLTYL